ncbi:MAG: tRNA (N6-threonylcarbamoyladenosine(37)-N6)-methyltransferase TrmO [Jiangellaceae bacterium]
MTEARYELRPIGWVESPLRRRDEAPRQGDEGAPSAWLMLKPDVREGIRDLVVGTEVILLTWLDRARRDVLAVHPRGDENRPVCGVFSTRSADRPNPIGLHIVEIVERSAVADTRLRVRNLEALDGTPILDIKPLLGPVEDR